MKRLINGEYVDIPEEEADEITRMWQKEKLESISNVTLTFEDVIEAMLAGKTISDNKGRGATPVFDAIGESFSIPFKLGYKAKLVEGSDGFAYEYVVDDTAIGTSEDNAIVYSEDMPLINNAFYKKDGIIQVYMNGEFVEW